MFGITTTSHVINILEQELRRWTVLEVVFVSKGNIDNVVISKNNYEGWPELVRPLIYKHIGGFVCLKPILHKTQIFSVADVVMSYR